MPETVSDARGRRAVVAIGGDVLAALPLAVLWGTAQHPSEGPMVRYSQVAMIPTALVCAVLVFLASRERRPVAAWLLAVGAVVMALLVVVGAGVYDEWTETQPGGRGYHP